MKTRIGLGIVLLVVCAGPVHAGQQQPAPADDDPIATVLRGGALPAGADTPPADAPLPDPTAFEGWSSGRYRITPTDVIELTFPYVPEFNQVVTVQPDGYITLRAVGEVRAQARTIPELRLMLLEAYAPIMRDPVVTITLKEFEKPYFVATGEILKPGKFELRGATTVTQALALAGGLGPSAKHSQIILFRRYSDELLEVKEIDVKKMYAKRDMSEDYVLRPGDTIYVPKSFISQIKPYLPTASFGFYLNPFNMW